MDVSNERSEERRVWVLRRYFVRRIVATLIFIAVNGEAIGLGRGCTPEDAREDAARRGLESLRGIYGVEEGVLKEKIERSKQFESNSPPSPRTLSFDLVSAPEHEKNGNKSFRLVPISGQEEGKGKSSFQRGLHRLRQKLSSSS